MAVSATPQKISTILGSCVAVCLWDAVRKTGGIVHYLLPTWDPSCGAKSPRYGNVGIEMLVARMEELNCRPSTMQARIFGGACVLKAFRGNGKDHLGQKNAALAREILSKRGIRIVEDDTSGFQTRKVLFDTATGVATVKHLGERDGN